MCAFNLVCPEINGRCWSQDCRSNDVICGWCIKRVFCQFLTESILRAQVTANVTFFFNDQVHSCDNLWVTNVLMTKGRDSVCGNALFLSRSVLVMMVKQSALTWCDFPFLGVCKKNQNKTTTKKKKKKTRTSEIQMPAKLQFRGCCHNF